MKTKTKVNIAKTLRFFHRGISALGYSNSSKRTVSRNGINWLLDLDEGIDFSIFLFGVFERESKKLYEMLSKSDCIVALDIGANFGSQSLLLASLLSESSKVFCFEPTRYAFSKLHRNLELNPDVAHKVFPRQSFLTSKDKLKVPEKVYSSWLLSNTDDEIHKMHSGLLKSTMGAVAETIDSFVMSENISKVDFIKLDVDGYENDVIDGGELTLNQFKPLIYFEYAPYVQYERGFRDGEILQRFSDLGYKIYYAGTLKRFDESRHNLEFGESVNLIADYENRLGIF